MISYEYVRYSCKMDLGIISLFKQKLYFFLNAHIFLWFYILAFTRSEHVWDPFAGGLFVFFFMHLGYQCSQNRNSLHSYQLPYFCQLME